MRLSPRLVPGVTALAAAAVSLAAPTAASATPSGWHRAAHGDSVKVYATPSDGHSTVVMAVDRRGRTTGSGTPGVATPHALSSTPLSTWHVIYDDAFKANAPAMAAFGRAVATWSHAVYSSQVITVNAKLEPFASDPTLLGDAGPATFWTPPPPSDWFYLPVALANSLSEDDNDPGAVDSNGSDVGPGLGIDDPAHADINATFSDNPNVFHFDDASGDPDTENIATQACTPVPTDVDPTPAPRAGACIDFESIVLHELGHGLGFLGSVIEDSDPTMASYGFDAQDERPYVFDLFTATGDGVGILDYDNHSAALHDAITSNSLYWLGPEGAAADRGREPELWAPAEYADGSSYSHLDDEAYPSGDVDELMTAYAEGGDITRDPGEVTLGMMRDIGWATPGLPGSKYTPTTPTRLLDTGATKPKVGNGGYRDLDLTGKVPAGATTAVLNLTTAHPVSTNTLRAYPVPRFEGAPIPSAVSLVTYAGDDRSDLVTVPISGGGPAGTALKVRVRNDGGAARVLVDLVGYYAPAAQLYFHPMTQRRFGDTRTGVGFAKRRLVAGQAVDLAVAGRGNVPTTAVATVLTVTAVKPSVHTYVTAYTPGGVSSGWAVNLNAGAVEANQAIVKMLNGKVRFRNYQGTTDLVVEVAGWYDTNPSGGTLFHNVLPQRVETPTASLGPGRTATVTAADGSYGAPQSAKAVVVNLLGTGPSASTYFTAYWTGSAVPVNSVLSLSAKHIAGVMATVPLGSALNAGKFTLRNSAGTTGYAVDLQGWFGTP